MIRKEVIVAGQIQGVGFRPFIYRLATDFNLTGFVYNSTSGVCIQIQGSQKNVEKFISLLKAENTEIPLMKISSANACRIAVVGGEQGFSIMPSSTQGNVNTQVTADIAVCDDCLAELFDPADFRYRYPFINCTNCGPRYSIIKTVPYDRPNTTMADFVMCPQCSQQYSSVADRRFHAQPVACKNCGPTIRLTDNKGGTIEAEADKIIAEAVRLLLDGNILAIKGLGGFHLAVDAQNDTAVKLLRTRKKRDNKPFAMMALSVALIRRFAEVDDSSARLLQSPQEPIVLLPKKTHNTIAASVARGVGSFGFMLSYTPLHRLLLSEVVDGKALEVIVATSGNVSDEPLICKNDTALAELSSIADVFLMHNREIYRQIDDSITQVIDNSPVILRRARGYVPVPILSARPAGGDIFAAGADLKNTFCFSKSNQFIVSEHIGDMENAAVYKHWLVSIEHLRKLFEVKPVMAVCDLHPGYLSSQYARSLKDIKLIEVQHHWAHIASVLAENETEDEVIGLCADGTGYGTDGAMWGCECLTASLDDFKRFGHLDYFPLPGSNIAAKEAIRPILGLAEKYGIKLEKSLLNKIEPDENKIRIINEQLEKNINTVQTSSLGRVFDAVAALCGLGSYNHFEAQLPMALEAIADEKIKDFYQFRLEEKNGSVTINIKLLIEELIGDLGKKVKTKVISAKFHNTIAEFFCQTAQKAKKQTGINSVAISGGVFCNKFLTNRLIEMLKKNGFRVLFNRLVPSNDGGISLGQAAIAAKKLRNERLTRLFLDTD